MSPSPAVLLLRHGETEWSRDGRHTGRTDIPLTERGERAARALGPLLAGLRPGLVLCSPLLRARRTAELAGLTDLELEDDLQEWDYGDVEGITTADWQVDHPGWLVWEDGAPGGEPIDAVGARADRVLDRVRHYLAGDIGPDEPAVLTGHGHMMRVLAARWLGLDARQGQLLRLDSGSLSSLGFEHAKPVLTGWNHRPVPA